MAIHHIAPERLSPGLTGQVNLVITNAGTGRTRPIELLEAPTPDLSPGTHCLIPSLGRGRSAVTTYPISAGRRGRFVIGPPQLRLGDPFGTWEDNRTLPTRTEVLVVPTVVALHDSPASGGMLSAASGRATHGSFGGDPDVGVRHYQRGDDIRTVHWRASAHHGELMVRQEEQRTHTEARLTEPVSHGGATILLDHRAAAHAGVGADSSIEVAISLAASVALHLLSSDHHVRLVSHSGRELAGGHDITDDVLAGLALLEPDRNYALSTAAVSGPGLLIAILGALDPATVALVIAARRRNTPAIAVVLATEDWGSDKPHVEARTQLLSAGWRVVVLGRGDELAEVWQRACATGDGFAAAGAARARR